MSKIELNTESLSSVGAHFGHPSSKWHPNFEKFISSKKNGIHIIDLVQTVKYLTKATKEISKIIDKGGSILFVGTKKQAKNTIQESADKCGMYYIVERWLGGTLTNFMTIKKSIKRLLALEKESSKMYKSITKKEHVMLNREKIKLSDLHRGIKNMKRLPSALFIVDGIHEIIAIREAKQLNIPTFGIIDSNTDPNIVDFPIPANDDSVKCIRLIMDYITQNLDYLNPKADAAEDDSESKSLSTNPSDSKDKKPEQEIAG
jgi:small subunit ribosomal protein S2